MCRKGLMGKNRIAVKMLAGVIMVTMLGTTVCGCGTNELASESAVIEMAKNDADNQAEVLTKLISTQVGGTTEGVDKEESVYVIVDANGTSKRVIVSDWLKNKEGSATLSDASDLADINNVKGDETYTKTGGAMTWAADGNDIYYQGTTNKELPVDVKVTYFLEGKEVPAEEIAGKSGKVKIRFDYTNKEKVAAMIGDNEEAVYVPFTVMSAMMLPTDTFSNVTVTNGKVMSEGNTNIVMGLAFPGLSDSLNLDREKLEEKEIEIPDYVEVNAYANDFKLDMTVSVVLSDALSDIHLTDSIDLSDLDEGVEELADGSLQLTEGTGKLADGVQELSDKTGEFQDGAKKLSDGVTEYTDGAAKLADGIGTAKDGAFKLADGANKLSAGANELNSKVQGVSLPTVTLSDEQKTAIGTQVASNPQLSASASQMASQIGEASKAGITAALGNESNQQAIVGAGVTAGVQTAGSKEVTLTQTVTIDIDRDAIESVLVGCDEATVNAVLALLPSTQDVTLTDTVDISSEVQKASQAAAATALYQTGEALKGIDSTATLTAACDGALKQAAQAGALAGAQGVADEVNKKLAEYGPMISQLKDGTAALANGAGELASGAAQLDSGMSELVNGAGTLVSNNSKLKDGANELYDGTNKLADGVDKLLTGANDLNDGMVKFDKEGITRLKDAYDGDGKLIVDRLSATMDAAKDYHTFTSLADGQDGSVKFIIRTEAVK